MFGSNRVQGPFEPERNLFGTNLFAAGAADVAMRADPRLHAIFFRAWVGADDDGAAGVILRDLGDELRVLFQRVRRFAVNREVCERARVVEPELSAQSFFNSMSILPIST